MILTSKTFKRLIFQQMISVMIAICITLNGVMITATSPDQTLGMLLVLTVWILLGVFYTASVTSDLILTIKNTTIDDSDTRV